MSISMCEGENKERDEKQSMLKQHLGLLRKNKISSFWKVQELLDTDFFWKPIPAGFGFGLVWVWSGLGLVWFGFGVFFQSLIITHFLYSKQSNVTSFPRIRWTCTVFAGSLEHALSPLLFFSWGRKESSCRLGYSAFQLMMQWVVFTTAE